VNRYVRYVSSNTPRCFFFFFFFGGGRDRYHIVHQNDEVKDKQFLLIEVLPTGDLRSPRTRHIISHETGVRHFRSWIAVPLQSFSALHDARPSDPRLVVLQPAQRIDERALSGAGRATHGKVQQILTVLSLILSRGEFLDGRPDDRLDSEGEVLLELFLFADGFCSFRF
jgi:hypothetical protein